MGDLALFFGRWHPLLVHLPIGMLIMAFLLEALGRKEKYRPLHAAVPVVLFCGGIGALLSCIAGFLLSQSGGYDEDALALHQWLGIGVTVLAFLAWFLKRDPAKFPSLQRVHFPLQGLMIVALSAAGHFGGSLTHGSGYLSQALPAPLKTLFGIEQTVAFEMPVIPDVEEAMVFDQVIQPILSQRCQSCHNEDKRKGDFRLDDPELLLKGGKEGPALLAGNPGESPLYTRLILPEDHDDHMPPKGKTQLEPAQIELIHWWIASGAPFDKKVKDVPRSDTVQELLLALEAGSEDGSAHAYVPASEVEAAPPGALDSLLDRGVKVLPLGQDSPFLQLSCINDPEFGDAETGLLLPLKSQIAWLDLSHTRLGDQGLKTLTQLENLTRLHLDHTAISDEGLAVLAECKQLRYLNLFGTKISDEGLQHLQHIPSLRELYLYQTEVSAEAIKQLMEKRPELRIDTGNYSLPLLAADTVQY